MHGEKPVDQEFPGDHRFISLYADQPPTTAIAARQAMIDRNQAYP